MGEAKPPQYRRSCSGISFLCGTLYAGWKSRLPVDWAVVEEEYSDARIDRAGDKTDLSRTLLPRLRRICKPRASIWSQASGRSNAICYTRSKPAGENYGALVVRMSPSTSILLRANQVTWTNHPDWEEGENSIIGKPINDLLANAKL